MTYLILEKEDYPYFRINGESNAEASLRKRITKTQNSINFSNEVQEKINKYLEENNKKEIERVIAQLADCFLLDLLLVKENETTLKLLKVIGLFSKNYSRILAQQASIPIKVTEPFPIELALNQAENNKETISKILCKHGFTKKLEIKDLLKLQKIAERTKSGYLMTRTEEKLTKGNLKKREEEIRINENY